MLLDERGRKPRSSFPSKLAYISALSRAARAPKVPGCLEGRLRNQAGALRTNGEGCAAKCREYRRIVLCICPSSGRRSASSAAFPDSSEKRLGHHVPWPDNYSEKPVELH